MAQVEIEINGTRMRFEKGTTIASAILASGIAGFRKSVEGELRSPLCGMGVCFECRVTIEGVAHEKSCQILVREGMSIITDE